MELSVIRIRQLMTYVDMNLVGDDEDTVMKKK
jgi:hypothetical protein